VLRVSLPEAIRAASELRTTRTFPVVGRSGA
jgi:hypothetical protein